MAYLAVNGNKVLDSSNYKDYCTPNNIGAASTDHTHNYAGSSSAGGDATNADKIDGYHASSLWRSDGATWNPSANVSLTATANSQEWSFDIRRNGYTGCYWHVWDSSLSTMLGVYADSGVVKMPYGAEAKTFKATSDRNLKHDIEKIDTIDITLLHTYRYTFKNDKSNERKVGLIAQEVQQIIPEAVSTNDNGNLMLDYNAVTAVLVSTVNELQNQIKILTEKTNCLTAEIASLKNQS